MRECTGSSDRPLEFGKVGSPLRRRTLNGESLAPPLEHRGISIGEPKRRDVLDASLIGLCAGAEAKESASFGIVETIGELALDFDPTITLGRLAYNVLTEEKPKPDQERQSKS